MEQINQILNDPGSMQQIMELASTFGTVPNLTEEGTNAENITQGITKVLYQTKEKEAKQQALVQALLPYLRPGHQKRLERAVQIARLSHLAGAALQHNGEQKNKEDAYDV